MAALTADSAVNVVKCCRKLKSLNLSLCKNINDECVRGIVTAGRNLKYLYLVSCNLTDKGECCFSRTFV